MDWRSEFSPTTFGEVAGEGNWSFDREDWLCAATTLDRLD